MTPIGFGIQLECLQWVGLEMDRLINHNKIDVAMVMIASLLPQSRLLLGQVILWADFNFLWTWNLQATMVLESHSQVSVKARNIPLFQVPQIVFVSRLIGTMLRRNVLHQPIESSWHPPGL